jgi:GNAT superfamily N-acetyltransferase
MNTLKSGEFRQASIDDIDELAVVFARAIAQRDELSAPDRAEINNAREDVKLRMGRVAAWTCAATRDDKIVGFALSHPVLSIENPGQHANTEHLSLLMVDPEHWEGGVGSSLIDRTVDHAREFGRSNLTLWTRLDNNSRTQEIYTHKGFTATGTLRETESGLQIQYQLDL